MPTPKGDARLVVRRAKRPVATLVLGHGAGGGIEAPDLPALARTLPKQDITVFLVEQPWRVAGKKLAPAPAVLDECFRPSLDGLRDPHPAGDRRPQRRGPVGLPDRAQRRGARRAGAVVPAAPARASRRSRASPSCSGARVPTLVVQGERDPFGTPEEFPADSSWPSYPTPTTR